MPHLFYFLAVTSVLVSSIFAVQCYFGSYTIQDGVVTDGSLRNTSCYGDYCIWETVVHPGPFKKKSFNCDIGGQCGNGGYADPVDGGTTYCCKGDYCNANKSSAVGPLVAIMISYSTMFLTTF